MPIVINDFEVLVEPPATGQAAPPTAPAEGGPRTRPADIVAVMRVHRERRRRLQAD